MRSKQNGFTLVELLVVIAIIGALIALLLPARQAAMIQSHRSLRRQLLSVIPLACSLVSAADAQSESPTASDQTHRWYDPRLYVNRVRRTAEQVRRLEIVEQLTALATGRPPDGGGGWFHDGQSRYGWEWLADRFDLNGDGQVSDDEFPPDATELLARLDRDRDGKIEKTDFDWSNDSPYAKQISQVKRLFGPVDRDRNGHRAAPTAACPTDCM